jgi:NADPH2:quinone reductase
MRAGLVTAGSAPELLELAELPEPEISGEHDVRVRLRAAGINPGDYKLRSHGTISASPPALLGWDGARVESSVRYRRDSL